MGTTHWGIYRGLKNARIVALADVDPKKRAGDVSAVVGNIGGGDNSQPLDLTGVTVYESAYALIANADVDVVDVCVPTPDHADIVCAALAAGKHVFCEKPLCRDAAQVRRIVAAAKKAKGFFNVGTVRARVARIPPCLRILQERQGREDEVGHVQAHLAVRRRQRVAELVHGRRAVRRRAPRPARPRH